MSYKITSTTNYDQFKKLEGQRIIVEKRVTNLVLSIQEKNKLILFPIIVNKNLEIVDGQHRLEAARRLKTPIYFIVDENGDEKDTIIIHSNRHNWSLNDYVNYYAHMGNEEYVFINDIWALYGSRIGAFSILLSIIRMFCVGNRRSLGDIRKGTIKLENKKELQEFLKETVDKALELSKLLRRFNKTSTSRILLRDSYLTAFFHCFQKMELKEYRNMLDYLKRDYTTLTSVAQASDAYKIIENSYNYGKKTGKIDFMNTIFPKNSVVVKVKQEDESDQ